MEGGKRDAAATVIWYRNQFGLIPHSCLLWGCPATDHRAPPSPQARKQQAAIALSPLFIFKRDAVMSRNCLLGIEIRWYWTWEGGVVLAAIVTWAWDHQGWYKSLWPFVCSVDQPSISISYHLINGASRWRRQDQVINKTSGVGRNLRPNEITVPTRHSSQNANNFDTHVDHDSNQSCRSKLANCQGKCMSHTLYLYLYSRFSRILSCSLSTPWSRTSPAAI